MSESLYVVMPVYNEAACIERVVKQWYPVLASGNGDSRMVVADGGSNDRTLSILYSLQKEFPKLVVLSRPGTDHGTKVILLYRYAIANGADWIFQTDSDGQTLPEEFPSFWAVRHDFDAILGNRKKRGDGYGRKIVEDVLRLLLKLYFGAMVPDANAPFRLMRSGAVNKYLGAMPEDFSLPNAVLAACFSRYRERVTYREITFRPRQGGKNHMNLKKIFKIGLMSLGSFAKVRNALKANKKEAGGGQR